MVYSRKKFITKCSVGALALFPMMSFANNSNTIIQKSGLDPKLVEEFVKVAHTDDAKVHSLLKETPFLINATQDWGNGDFESAIGATGHMGNKELTNHLIKKGARPDIFVLTMLGKTTVVKSLINDYPELLNSIGPHGFTLLHHAKKGGTESNELFDFLSEKGLTKTFIKTF